MPSEDLEYPKQPYSKVNRYDVRATYALKTIHELVNTCPILQVSFAVPDSPFPMLLPMIGQMGSFERPSADTGDVLELYLHGYVSSRVINLARRAGGSGLPITVGAAHLDGLVLSLTPNTHSYNYRSAVLFGRAELVADEAEKVYAMSLITDGVVRDRYRHTRTPPSGAELQSTGVLRVRIEAGSAKIRAGMPSDDRRDLADEDLLDRVWTGVLPVHYALADPVPGPYNRLPAPPAYLEDFVRSANRDAAEIAAGAATKVMKPKAKGEE
ncbi:hypothetical protein F4861DRAFT_536802 [Xylaria intraflava]|nr:hypothetical protein F4861DRAFT_536802 [Xylaria intraflava]